MLAQLDWPAAFAGAASMLGVISIVLGVWWGVVQIRQSAHAAKRDSSNPGNPGNPGPPPCGEMKARVGSLEARTDARDAADIRLWEKLDDHGSRLVRMETVQGAMHDDVREIKQLVKNGGRR